MKEKEAEYLTEGYEEIYEILFLKTENTVSDVIKPTYVTFFRKQMLPIQRTITYSYEQDIVRMKECNTLGE